MGLKTTNNVYTLIHRLYKDEIAQSNPKDLSLSNTLMVFFVMIGKR